MNSKKKCFVMLVFFLFSGCLSSKKGGSGEFHDSGVFQGGHIKDGADLKRIEWKSGGIYETVEMHFYSWEDYNGTIPGKPLEKVPYFNIEKKDYPHTLEILFGGTRAFSARTEIPVLNGEVKQKSSFIENIYPVIYLDDSAVKFSVTFKRQAEFQVVSMASPARLVLKIREASTKKSYHRVFSVRTFSGVTGEQGDMLREYISRFTGKSARYLRDNAGEYIVEAGYYETIEEALYIKEKIQEKHSYIELFIEQRGENCLPCFRDSAGERKVK